MQMPVEGLEHELHPGEERVACDCVPRVAVANERGENCCVAVSLARAARLILSPELRDLREPARDPRALTFAVLRNQLLLECGHRLGSPRGCRPTEDGNPPH